MATTNLGRVAIVPKGVYDVGTTYEKLDLVTGDGGSYMYINPTPAAGVLLTDTTHWQQIAEKGDKGDTGEQGVQGNQGIQSINRTSGDGTPGSTDTYTILYNDGTSSDTFTVYNGADNPNFTHIEEGLQHTSVAFSLHYAITQAMIRDLDTRLAVAEAELATIP